MYLLGASGHAKVISDILRSNNVLIEGFFDDNKELIEFDGLKSLGPITNASSVKGEYLIAIGANTARQKISEQNNLDFAVAIHPKAIIHSEVPVEEGTVIMAGAVVNVDSKIGRHVIINTGAVVDHDCTIGDFAHLSPNSTLSGNVEVKEGAHIGSGAVIIPGVTIGKWATVGAGTVVIEDVEDGATVVGSPARRIK